MESELHIKYISERAPKVNQILIGLRAAFSNNPAPEGNMVVNLITFRVQFGFPH